MKIDFNKFAKWAINRFGEENVLIKSKEIRINSIFTEDSSFHLWCSPSGGKNKRKFGVYHCFKTDQKGSLLKLIKTVDHCDTEDAIAALGGRISIRDLEAKLEEMLSYHEEEVSIPIVKNNLELPEGCFLISDLPKKHWWRIRAEDYLLDRKIPIDGLYICTKDRYKNRIVIPYYNRQGQLIYWNARHLGKSKCKYLGPPKEIGVGKEDVVYMAGKWPEKGSLVYLCEGEFNAISLTLCEFNAAACGGKNMSEKQAIMLSDYKIVLCLDRDKAGQEGTMKMISYLSSVEKQQGSEKINFVVPPIGYNDWNEVLKKDGAVFLHHYIKRSIQPIDYSWPYGKHTFTEGFYK